MKDDGGLLKKLKDFALKNLIPDLKDVKKDLAHLNEKHDNFREEVNSSLSVVHKRIDDTNFRITDLKDSTSTAIRDVKSQVDKIEIQNRKIISYLAKLKKSQDQAAANKN